MPHSARLERRCEAQRPTVPARRNRPVLFAVAPLPESFRRSQSPLFYRTHRPVTPFLPVLNRLESTRCGDAENRMQTGASASATFSAVVFSAPAPREGDSPGCTGSGSRAPSHAPKSRRINRCQAVSESWPAAGSAVARLSGTSSRASPWQWHSRSDPMCLSR